MEQRPGYFLIGAPKCGTTALATYLDDHPDVLFSAPKEPNHFSVDLRPSRYESDADYVAQCFPGIADHSVAVEGSTLYLVSDVAVDNILRFNPEAKFIVMLRNPIQMFNSWYHHIFAMGLEKERTPTAAWRARGAASTYAGSQDFATNYQALCSLGQQVERLLQKVDRKRVQFLLFDDLKQEPQTVYQQTLQFLGVADDGRTDFPVVNVSRATGSMLLHWVVRAWSKFRGLTGIRLGIGQTKLVQKIFFGRKQPVDDGLRGELRSAFREDVQLLSRLIDRDLSHWM